MAFFDFILKRRNKQKVDFIFFCIGNHGEKYKNTRHNVGFMVADRLIDILSDKYTIKKKNFDSWAGNINNRKVIVVKPKTFVNLSVNAIDSCNKLFNVSLDSYLVIVDDLNLPLGTLRLRPSGSDGGHKGIGSIIKKYGSNFKRLRIGIGPLPENVDAKEFVLSEFLEKEKEILNIVIDKAVEAAQFLLTNDILSAMNKFNNFRTEENKSTK